MRFNFNLIASRLLKIETNTKDESYWLYCENRRAFLFFLQETRYLNIRLYFEGKGYKEKRIDLIKNNLNIFILTKELLKENNILMDNSFYSYNNKIIWWRGGANSNEI
jgi:hypothetical protein